MFHAGTKSVRPFIASSSELQQEVTLTKAALSLLSRIEHKKQERWEEAINSIDFSQSNRKA